MPRFQLNDRVYYSIVHRNTSGRPISADEGLAKIIDFNSRGSAVILDLERGRQKTIPTRFLEKAEFGGARRSKTRKSRVNRKRSTRKN